VIVCDAPGAGAFTNCRATVGCSLYSCAPDIPEDVTTAAEWTSDAPEIMRIASPGRLEAVSPGDTVVRAKWTYGAGATSYWRHVSVFPGTAPLPTYQIAGRIYDVSVSPRVPLDGVTIEILNGLVAGRRATSGSASPMSMPGFTPPPDTLPGSYYVPGVPSGTHRLRVSKDGYVSQERDVTSFTGVDFELARQ
jgi:hypothetical protein